MLRELATLTLLHYWNFNDITSLSTFTNPTFSIGGGALNFDFTTVLGTLGYYDSTSATASTLNAQNGDPAGDALRIRNPSIDFIIAAPTTNYKNIVLTYAVESSSATYAALTDSIYYTTDGTTYTNAGLATKSYDLTPFVDPNYTLETFDFSSIPAVNNNANFKVKIVFSNGNLNTKGNDRFDNITVQGFHQ